MRRIPYVMKVGLIICSALIINLFLFGIYSDIANEPSYDINKDPMIVMAKAFCSQHNELFREVWVYGFAAGTAIACGNNVYKVVQVGNQYSQIK